jgi:hypothetical protein
MKGGRWIKPMLRRLDVFQYTDLAAILSKDERIDYTKKNVFRY